MIAPELSELSVRQLLARRRRLTAGVSDPGADVTRGAASEGRRLLERGVPLPAGRAARPVHVSGGLPDGRSRTVYVPAALAAAAEQHVELTQRNEALLAEISQINLELLGAGRCGDVGWRASVPRRPGGGEHARRGASGERAMREREQKIKGQHLERLASVYLRQSSPRQVRENFRSTERQYGLAEEAVRLGWEPERVLTIDGDLGISGRDAHAREAYKELVGRVCLGEVGAIFGLEVSRLARSSAETAAAA